MNNVNGKYFIGYWNGIEYPHSIDKCNPTDIFGSSYQRARCVDENNVVVSTYTNRRCTGTPTSTTIYNSSYQTRGGTLYDFNCDNNATDSYVSIEYLLFSCTNSGSNATLSGAIGVCTFVENDQISFQIYCEENWMETYFFDSFGDTQGDCANNDDIYNTANATNMCGFIFKPFGIKIYGKVCILFCVFFWFLFFGFNHQCTIHGN